MGIKVAVHFEAVRAEIDEAAISAWIEGRLNEGRNIFIRNVSRGGGGGKLYRRGNQWHKASAPGEYPATDGGRLVNSPDTRMESPREGVLFSEINYAEYLTRGTRHMLPRKMLAEALDEAIRAAPLPKGVVRLHRQFGEVSTTHAPLPYVSLYEAVTRRIRAAGTMFGESVKLVLRQRDDDHWSLLALPYLLVVPTVSRSTAGNPQAEDYDSIVVPRSVTLIAQLDGRGTEAEYAAAGDIEQAERQLIFALVNWRPTECYKATQYGGMRIAGTRLPDVKASFVFVFPEEIGMPDEEVGVWGEVDQIMVDVNAGCCPPDPIEPVGDVPPIR